MALKEYAIFPVRAGEKGPWMVWTSTIHADGLDTVRGKTLAEFNRHLADVIPNGVKVAVIDKRKAKPVMVTGHRVPDLAA